jgi:hypothetical protein
VRAWAWAQRVRPRRSSCRQPACKPRRSSAPASTRTRRPGCSRRVACAARGGCQAAHWLGPLHAALRLNGQRRLAPAPHPHPHPSQPPPPPCLLQHEALASSAVRAAAKLQAALIVVFTVTGRTPRVVAKYRPSQPILTVRRQAGRGGGCWGTSVLQGCLARRPAGGGSWWLCRGLRGGGGWGLAGGWRVADGWRRGINSRRPGGLPLLPARMHIHASPYRTSYHNHTHTARAQPVAYRLLLPHPTPPPPPPPYPHAPCTAHIALVVGSRGRPGRAVIPAAATRPCPPQVVMDKASQATNPDAGSGAQVGSCSGHAGAGAKQATAPQRQRKQGSTAAR